METKLIKTCHGLVEVRFADGALLPADVQMVNGEVLAGELERSAQSRILHTAPVETQESVTLLRRWSLRLALRAKGLLRRRQ